MLNTSPFAALKVCPSEAGQESAVAVEALDVVVVTLTVDVDVLVELL